MSRLAAACLMLLAPLAATARDTPDDFDAVLHLFAARNHGEASFVEQHFVSLLKQPIESFGELIYDAPDRLEKRTLGPHPETLVLVGHVLTVTRGHHSHVLDLNSYPQALPFVESIRATLAGDRMALQKTFRCNFSGTPAGWTLILVPLDRSIEKIAAQITLNGSRADLLNVEIRQSDGDRSLMTLRNFKSP